MQNNPLERMSWEHILWLHHALHRHLLTAQECGVRLCVFLKEHNAKECKRDPLIATMTHRVSLTDCVMQRIHSTRLVRLKLSEK